MAKDFTHLHESNEKKKEKNNKKKKKVLPIILWILGILLLLILGTVLLFYLKAKAMSRNAVPTLPDALEIPSVTAEPDTLNKVDRPSYDEGIPDGNEIDPRLDVVVIDGKEYTDSSYFDIYGDDVWDLLDRDPDDPDAWRMPYGSDPIYYVPQIDKNVINILIVGTDTRNEKTDRGRSDSMMVLSYNTKKRKAKLFSILRDTYVYIPGRNRWNKINAAYQFGGVGLTINTINANFGLDIQCYIKVNFQSSIRLINAIGGLDMDLSVKEIQYINKGFRSNKLPLEAGVHHLDGEQVLRHARNRRVGNCDWDRTKRQREVLNALLNRAKKEKNPATMVSLIYQLADKLDTNMSVEKMASLVVDVVFGGAFSMENRAVPFEKTWHYSYEQGLDVVNADLAANRAKLREYLYGN